MFQTVARACRTAVLLAALLAPPALSQGTGEIVGVVTDDETKKPIPYANVIVDGTALGAMTLADGTFRIPGLVPGEYRINVLMMGYAKAVVEARVTASGKTRVEIAIRRAVNYVAPTVYSVANRVEDDVTGTQAYHGMGEKKIEHYALDDVDDVVRMFTGVVDMGGGEKSVRGGRPDETKEYIDGVPVEDPLGGGQLNVSLFSTEAVEFISGGMDAEYGDAQSAIVNLTTKEGGEHFGGEFRYWTDDFGRQDKSYTNYDRVSLGFGGPAWVDDVRYYVSGEATFSDDENTLDVARPEHKITEWLKFRERASQAYSVQSKLSWTRGGAKVTAEVIASHSSFRPYRHNWNIQGYVRKVYYFQALKQLIPASGGELPVYGFAGVTVVPHGAWASDRSHLNPRPILVRDVERDPNTGEPETVTYEHFRALDIDDQTVLFDEVIVDERGAPIGTKSWILFEGYQSPYSEFSTRDEDSSFVAFNSATRSPAVTSDQLHTKVSFAHNISEKLLYRFDLSRLELRSLQTVAGKTPEEFETAGLPVTLPDGTYLEGGLTTPAWYTDPDHPYFVTAYDFPFYADQRTVQYVAQTSVTTERWQGHRIKSGVQVVYNDLEGEQRVRPGEQRVNRVLGTVQQGINANLFHNFNPEGAFYVQDKWQHEGMVLNGGIRLDYFSTGNNNEILIHNEEVDPVVDTQKLSISPRLGVAFPITDRDKFFFHYGRFTQWPGRPYLFSTQDPIGAIGTLGNPNLDFELTVSYQAGVSHYFTDDVTGNFIIFNKDIYGLVTSASVTDDTTGLERLRHVNRAYASARGLEVTLEKRLAGHFGFDVAYTYSFADGVASSADFGRSAEGLTHLPTDELPLDWDQRHTLNVSMRLRDRASWLLSISYFYGSGLPWTPYDRFARLQDPTWENSRRLPPTHLLNLRGQKNFNAWGQRLSFLFEGRNLLDQDVLLRNMTSPGVAPGMQYAQMDQGSYLTETGRYGGAYLQDIDSDGVNEFIPVNDPSVWQPHRVWRVGFGLSF
jgi:hypothetical protein